ncbi:MAG TPA: DUF465 domain-containing protein [Candidatus Binatia bacterium]|nr:DUF465 domain-containing protein [Candidatus Binatia bacterium]
MEKHEEELIRSLLDKDVELKRYYEEHVALEKQLATFQHKHFLTPEEEVEKKRLQKLKLAGKDHIMEILGKYRTH